MAEHKLTVHKLPEPGMYAAGFDNIARAYLEMGARIVVEIVGPDEAAKMTLSLQPTTLLPVTK